MMPTPAAATTPNGLPYPESIDPLSEGANDIKALAMAVDPHLRVSPLLWVYRLGTVTYPNPYVYQSVNTDTDAGWDLANGRYTVKKTGVYLAVVKAQMNGSGGSACPGIQIAPTVTGTYVTKIGSAVTGTGGYMGNSVTAVLPLVSGNGVRVVELAGAGWTADIGNDGSNYFQLAYLGL